MPAVTNVIHCDPDILSGEPVFVGTRVPLQSLIDYLAAGDPLETFLDAFPSVTHQQTVAALELAGEALADQARRDGAVPIRRREDEVIVLRPESAITSPLNVPGLKLAITRDDIGNIVHEGRRPV